MLEFLLKRDSSTDIFLGILQKVARTFKTAAFGTTILLINYQWPLLIMLFLVSPYTAFLLKVFSRGSSKQDIIHNVDFT